MKEERWIYKTKTPVGRRASIENKTIGKFVLKDNGKLTVKLYHKPKNIICNGHVLSGEYISFPFPVTNIVDNTCGKILFTYGTDFQIYINETTLIIHFAK
jgi:hypothetical protein